MKKIRLLLSVFLLGSTIWMTQSVPHALAVLPDSINVNVEGKQETVTLDSVPDLKSYLQSLPEAEQQSALQNTRAWKVGELGNFMIGVKCNDQGQCEKTFLVQKRPEYR